MLMHDYITLAVAGLALVLSLLLATHAASRGDIQRLRHEMRRADEHEAESLVRRFRDVYDAINRESREARTTRLMVERLGKVQGLVWKEPPPQPKAEAGWVEEGF